MKNERRANIAQLAQSIQKPVPEVRVTMEWLVEAGMAEGIGNGTARRYMLSSKVYSATGNAAGYTRQRGLSTQEERTIILSHLDKEGQINRSTVIDLCKCTPSHASWLLRTLLDKGCIVKFGQSRSTKYVRP